MHLNFVNFILESGGREELFIITKHNTFGCLPPRREQKATELKLTLDEKKKIPPFTAGVH